MKLYELAIQHQQLMQLDGSEDIPAEVIRDTLEGLEGEIQDKAHSIARMIENLDAEAEAIMDASKAMRERSCRVSRRADEMRNYLMFQLLACGITKLKFTEFTVAVRDNPEAVRINDDAVIPAEFMVTPEPPPPAPDKKALKAAIKAGTEIRGVWLERGQRLEVKA
jgi:hypothetical protein